MRGRWVSTNIYSCRCACLKLTRMTTSPRTKSISIVRLEVCATTVRDGESKIEERSVVYAKTVRDGAPGRSGKVLKYTFPKDYTLNGEQPYPGRPDKVPFH
jgi:hypothetical protein